MKQKNVETNHYVIVTDTLPLLKNDCPSIINIASQMVKKRPVKHRSHGPAKAGNQTKCAYARYGIRVNAVRRD